MYSFTKEQAGIVVKEIYMIDRGLEMRRNSVGMWKGGVLTWDDDSIFDRRKDFHGYQFEAVTLPDPPVTTVHDGEKLRIGGYLGKVWHRILETHMNFSTRIIISPDGKWGARDENGTWNGMIQALQSKEAQLALTGLIILKSRSEVVDFSPSLLEANIGMFVKFPERESSWTTFIQPFDHYVWFTLMMLLLLFLLTLSLTYHVGHEKHINPGSFTISYNFLMVLGALMGQGSSIEPKSFATRAAFIPIFFLAIFIITCYSAEMIAFLTFFKIQNPFETLDDVLLTDYKVGTLDGGAEHDMLANAKEGTIFKKVFDLKMSESRTWSFCSYF